MTAPWPCRCGADGVRNVGSFGYCPDHLAELYELIRPELWNLNGRGLLVGKLRPEFGEFHGDLRCNACGATWVGRIDDLCRYCQRARAAIEEHQREMLLQPPEVPTEAALMSWGVRLRRAVDVKIITRAEAQRAWARAVTRASA